ncbi:MAG: isochorismatase family protein [Nanoarchaeota archaeon]
MTLKRIIKKRVYTCPESANLINLINPAANMGEALATPPRDLGVLLIDMQDFFVQHIVNEDLNKMVAHQARVLNYCREYDIPVFVLEFYGCGNTIKILSDKIDVLQRKERITKRCDDGFENTILAAQLHAEGVRNVMLMGINASYCVRDTAAGAVNNRFSVMTSRQLIADPCYNIEKTLKFEKSIKWYEKRGLYSDDYMMLLRTISAGR